jgi:hypothetical protein
LQEDPLTIMVLRQRDHHQVANCLSSGFQGVSAAVVEEGATEGTDRVVNREAIDTENLDRASRTKTPESGGRCGRLDAEGPLENRGGLGL